MTPEEIEFAAYAAELPDPAILDEYDQVIKDGRLRMLKLRRLAGSWEAVGDTMRDIIGW